MLERDVWHLKIDKQLRLRIGGENANRLKSITKLPSLTQGPINWWANVGDKGQLTACPAFVPPKDADRAIDEESLMRYSAGMVLSFRREEENRIAIQLPLEGFYAGVIPDVGASVAVYARPGILEIWKSDHWLGDATKTASLLSAHLARVGTGV